ncbi:MAG TPA: heat-inducible transcriptional repressor HrcA [Gemmatimonadales bacterium]|nr:heat-inducible transcriptional repressor HrcA [Gemmatimonadales bacterium]
MPMEGLTDREIRVLEAVIQVYIETAEPAGSQTVAQRFPIGVSSATIRNTMSELEEKGYLYHPHTSAGRIPTDRAYRWYVDNLLRLAPPSHEDQQALQAELVYRSAMEEILRRAAQVLGVLTQELGVAVAPAFDRVILERLDLVTVASDRLLLVFHLKSGAVRTIFVEVARSIVPEAVQRVAQILNERLAGLSLAEIRTTLSERLRDADSGAHERELLNIFIEEGEEIFSLSTGPETVVLGSAQMLAGQPEFATSGRIRDLLDLTERRDLLRQALSARRADGLTITIGGEHNDSRLTGFTLVTSSYRSGDLTGVIGVIGPTRMPYDKIIGLVDHTSRLVEGLME